MNGAALGTTELHVLRSRVSLDKRFLFYVTISSLFRSAGESEMYGAGGQKRVPPEFCKDFRLPLPLFGEQVAIANFLDTQSTKLDSLIAKKQTLIGNHKNDEKFPRAGSSMNNEYELFQERDFQERLEE